ncbi:MAG: SDR family oxidoreductase [Pseudomonadota bacterium]
MIRADLTGHTAVVTAAAQGIGRASVTALAECGAVVWATDINADGLTGYPDTVHTLQLDVRDRSNIDEVIGVAQPSILVNCAGFVHGGTVEDITDGDWDFALSLNVRSMVDMMQAALPAMKTAGRGSIVNISSVASSLKAVPNRCLYSTTKAAILGLTKSVAADYITQGIRCNAICPGTVDTPSLHDRLRATGDYDAAHAAFVARQPMGRLGTTEEIASLVVYLASDEAAFVTGQPFIIDGGWAG